MLNPNMHAAEFLQVASGFVPINMATGANTGDWCSLKNYGAIAFVFHKGAGTAGQDPTLTLQQATTATGTSAKALNITRVDKKQGAALTSIGQFTKSTSDSPAANDTFSTNTWTNSTLAEEQAIVVLMVRAEDLDIDGGFDFVQLSIADVGTNSQIGGLLAIGLFPRELAEALPTMIA